MNLTKILTFVLFGISIYLGYYLYSGVQKTVDDRKMIEKKEAAVIEKLKLIREAEKAFQEVNGRYTSNWDSLLDFVKHGQVAIVERREELIQKEYGGEDVIVHIDTLGFTAAKERIFKQTFNVTAADNGTFMGYKVKVGDRAVKNQRGYALKVGDKTTEPPFIENGFISSLTPLNVGDKVNKGQILMTIWDYKFNPNVDLERIAYKPGTDTKFDIFVGKVDRGGIMVDVIEVKDPSPDSPFRSEANEAKNRKPLRFGSRTDVSTSGNWES
ncbi:MAG TPA: hypothetical protein PKW06_09650 [Cyclobacteriaceae bacterium]|nr:hypothetical protein [Cyclobacteriaceae bacterium]MCB9238886.1 hypothetical protein [Flammeovirgaceae bacterium]MCB0498162.1 hypothetical protein [Cyclobacteriaceae bacterium]MCO5270605.1 hypothetical protein [Cyclobacteriaceae bacterium]MCW5900954.1 hypothetical protein [Cyclobacteriaceae bacterium]